MVNSSQKVDARSECPVAGVGTLKRALISRASATTFPFLCSAVLRRDGHWALLLIPGFLKLTKLKAVNPLHTPAGPLFGLSVGFGL